MAITTVTLRALSILALAIAALVWIAVVRPAARDLAAAQQQFGRAREERERLRLGTAVLERQVAAHARLVAASAAGSGDPVKALRLFVLDSVSRGPLADVRLETSAGRGATRARVRLSAVGSFHEVLRLGERLVGPGSGLAVERVQLSGAASGKVQAELEGFTLGASSP